MASENDSALEIKYIITGLIVVFTIGYAIYWGIGRIASNGQGKTKENKILTTKDETKISSPSSGVNQKTTETPQATDKPQPSPTPSPTNTPAPTNTPTPTATPIPSPPVIKAINGPFIGWSSLGPDDPGGTCFTINGDQVIGKLGLAIEFSWSLDGGTWTDWNESYAARCFGNIPIGPHKIEVKGRYDETSVGPIFPKNFTM